MSIWRRSKRWRTCWPRLSAATGALPFLRRSFPTGRQTCGSATGVEEPIMRPSPPKSIRLDLFGPSNDSRPLEAPRRLGLPDRTRRRATVLMARMLLEHRGGQAGEAETGTGGESGDVRQDPAPGRFSGRARTPSPPRSRKTVRSRSPGFAPRRIAARFLRFATAPPGDAARSPAVLFAVAGSRLPATAQRLLHPSATTPIPDRRQSPKCH